MSYDDVCSGSVTSIGRLKVSRPTRVD